MPNTFDGVDRGPGLLSAEGDRGRDASVRRWPRVLALVSAVLLLVLAGLYAWAFDVFPPVKPRSDRVEALESVLRQETASRWGGRVDLESGELVLERGETDFPPHEYRTYTYLAQFRVAGTNARFVVPFPVDASREELGDWGMFSAELSESEVQALEGYSATGGPVPIMIWREAESYGRAGAEEIWRVTPLDRQAVFLSGEDVLIEKRLGAYRAFDPSPGTAE